MLVLPIQGDRMPLHTFLPPPAEVLPLPRPMVVVAVVIVAVVSVAMVSVAVVTVVMVTVALVSPLVRAGVPPRRGVRRPLGVPRRRVQVC